VLSQTPTLPSDKVDPLGAREQFSKPVPVVAELTGLVFPELNPSCPLTAPLGGVREFEPVLMNCLL